jgi:1-deoxy-D-xylulose-5-phosphate synthase
MAKNVSDAIENSTNANDIAHYDMRFVKPLDEVLLHDIFTKHQTIITIEDNSIKGGFGSTVLEFAAKNNYKNTMKLLGIPDAFIEHGSVIELQKTVDFDTESLIKLFDSFI